MSGKPASACFLQPPTWEAEYRHFKQLCATGGNNIDNDIWINDALADLSRLALKGTQ